MPNRQEDAHEFMCYLIDHLCRESLGSIRKDQAKFFTKTSTAVKQIFGGYFQNQIVCMQCRSEVNKYDYFTNFMLEISKVDSLDGALKRFVAPELLTKDNSYACSKCKAKVTAKKRFTVHKAPAVATFQLKRFDVWSSGSLHKINKRITFPEVLDLSPYMSGEVSSHVLALFDEVISISFLAWPTLDLQVVLRGRAQREQK